MSKSKQLTDEEIHDISEKSGVDPDVLKSWYKGMFLFLIYFFNTKQGIKI